jgi:hypothetical protein
MEFEYENLRLFHVVYADMERIFSKLCEGRESLDFRHETGDVDNILSEREMKI